MTENRKEGTDNEDWRLTGQEEYLSGVKLVKRAYRQNLRNPKWDHDHCEFCFSKFSLDEESADVSGGYATLDDYRWICEKCFEDFHKAFQWNVVPADAED